jgi:ATP-dependent RNA helicase DDX52/ROK1
MDVFRLLSRGANIQKKGKHEADLQLFKPAPPSEETGVESLVASSIDFFKSAEPTKRKRTRRRSTESSEDAQEISEPSEPLTDRLHGSLSISSELEAAEHRKRLRIKVTGDDIPLPIGSFNDLGTRFNMPGYLLNNLINQNFPTPTPIQSEAIPILLHGRDMIGCAPTGSGKTLAFVVPLVQCLGVHKNIGIRALIISPTKELATQIYNETVKLTRGSRDLSVCLLNKAQAAKFRNNDHISRQKFDILISTPLRLVDCVNHSSIDLSQVEYLVLDEADKLFEQGFVEQTDEILTACSNPRLRKALFSATIHSGVEQLATQIMVSPVRVIVNKGGASVDVDQKIVYAGNEQGKLIAIRQMVQNGELKPPVIVFVQSIQRAKALFHELLYDKVNVDVIHGERTQTQRDKVIDRFKQSEIWVLICTDVLSRGIDFRGVNLVINYDVPQSSQAYVHRIGRTGRAGRHGSAITFYTKEDSHSIMNVVNVMKASGCNVEDWLLRLPKMSKNEKKNLKKRPMDRNEITTVPSAVRKKRRQRQEMIVASKKRAMEKQGESLERDES